MADSERVRVALFGRFCGGDCEPETIQARKKRLREEANKRGYAIIDEFWEEGVAEDTPLDEREEMRRLMRLVWAEELIVDGIFLAELSELGWSSRKEHVTFTTFFELNDLSIITYDETYRPDDWAVACSF